MLPRGAQHLKLKQGSPGTLNHGTCTKHSLPCYVSVAICCAPDNLQMKIMGPTIFMKYGLLVNNGGYRSFCNKLGI
jgi:hypothetical protein